MLNEYVLRAIMTLAEELHFGRAAARLHLSQSALSGIVKKIEADLGVLLFQRTSRQVEITDAGKIFVAEAGRLLEETARAIDLVRGSSPDSSGPLRIGYTMGVNVRWLCSLISRARKESLFETEPHLVTAEPLEIREKLVKGSLNAAFFSGMLSHADIESIPLFREPFRVVFSAANALTRARRVTLDRLWAEPIVWLRRDADHLLYDHFMRLCSSLGYRPRIAHEVRNFSACMEFAREALGVTFVPSSFETSGDRALAVRQLPDSTLYLEQRLACRRQSMSPDVARLFRFAQQQTASARSMTGRG